MTKTLAFLFSLLIATNAHAQKADAPTPSELADAYIKSKTGDSEDGETTATHSGWSRGGVSVNHSDFEEATVGVGDLTVEFSTDDDGKTVSKPTIDLGGGASVSMEDGKPTFGFSLDVIGWMRENMIGAGVSDQMNQIIGKIHERVNYQSRKQKGKCPTAALNGAWGMTFQAEKSRTLRGAGHTTIDIIENLAALPAKMTTGLFDSFREKAYDTIKGEVQAAIDGMLATSPPDIYTNSSGTGWFGGGPCEIQMRVIWNKNANNYRYIIVGDCKCEKVNVYDTDKNRGKVRMKSFMVSGEGEIRNQVYVSKGKDGKAKVNVKWTPKSPTINVSANCMCGDTVGGIIPPEDDGVQHKVGNEPKPEKRKPPKPPKKPRKKPPAVDDGIEIELEDARGIVGENAFDAGNVERLSEPRDDSWKNPAGGSAIPESQSEPEPDRYVTPPPDIVIEEPPINVVPEPPVAPPPLELVVDMPTALSFSHKVGAPPEGSPCPTNVPGGIRISAKSGNRLEVVSMTVSGNASPVIQLTNLGTPTKPFITAAFNCADATPRRYNGTINVTVRDTVTGETKTISRPISGKVVR